MSRADEIRAKAARQKAREQAAADEFSAPAPPAAPTVRAKPIRSTVDLPSGRHSSLKTWCTETATELGRARVTTQDVVNALVHRLLTDETLARKIRQDLRNQ